MGGPPLTHRPACGWRTAERFYSAQRRDSARCFTLVCSEDEYELSYVYGPDATNADVHARSVAPLLRKLLEGYNCTVLAFGATGGPRMLALARMRART